MRPKHGEVNKNVREYLNKYKFNCPNYCMRDDVSYTELMKHMKEDTCTGYGYSERAIRNVEERTKEIEKIKKWFVPDSDSITLREEWNHENAL